MKSSFVALVLVSFMSVAAFADAPASLSVTSTDASVYNVVYKASEAGKVKVSIYTKRNQLVFSEVLTNVTSFKRPYNFSELEEGEYTIVLEDKNGKQVETVNYTIASKIASIINVKKLTDNDNKYVLNVITNKAQDVFVKIYNEKNTLIYVQTVEVSGYFGLIYDLSKVRSSNEPMTIEVSTGGQVESVVLN